MKKFLTLIFALICILDLSGKGNANKGLISGPMLGFVEHRSALIWVEVATSVEKLEIEYFMLSEPKSRMRMKYQGTLGAAYNPCKIELPELKMNTKYGYQIIIDGKKISLDYPTEFMTRDLWEYRRPAPDFSFLIGSCLYLNDSAYDRPGKPYGLSTDILKPMARDTSRFMIWMGDNNYLREADYSSPYGIMYRYSHDRAVPALQPVLAKRPNYAIWDDHDYGANDTHEGWKYKGLTNEIFRNYWGNHSYAQCKGEGIYGNFNYGDAEFFLMDDRYFRAEEELKDSMNGKPNVNKRYWGEDQMRWLENNLLSSHSVFKFIVNGNQVSNSDIKVGECMVHYPYDYYELLNFINTYKISGVVILSGDRHFSELLSTPSIAKGGYNLMEYTSSPLTSTPYYDIIKGKEGENPFRIKGSLQAIQNFGKVSIHGEKGHRIATIQTLDISGSPVFNYDIKEEQLKFAK